MIDIDNLIGKPYKIDGRGPNFYDCWGLCLEIAKRLGKLLPEHQVPKSEKGQAILAIQVKNSDFVRLSKPEPWCLVVFRVWDDNGKEKWHVGTVLEDCRRFIHITRKSFVCTPLLKHRLWDMFLEGFYKYAC